MTSTPQSTNPGLEQDEEQIDLKEVLFKYLKYWPYIIGCTFLGIFCALLANRYATPIYKIESTVLVNDEPSGALGADLFENAGLSVPKSNVENEMGILKSYTLAHEALSALNFNIFYYKDGFVKKTEIYGNSSFLVEADWNHPQLVGGMFSIKKINEQKFNLEIVENDFFVFSPSDPHYKTRASLLENIAGEYAFGSWIQDEHFKFKVSDLSAEPGEEIYFHLTDTPSLANAYRSDLEVNPLNKNSTILTLSLELNNRRKGEDYLNKLMEVYLERELLEKNKSAANTVYFIDQQLSGITDSLSYIEDRLETYRSNNNVFNLTEEGTAIFQRLEELEKEKAQINLSLRYYRTLTEYLKEEQLDDLVAPSVIGIQDPLLNALVISMAELQSERVRLTATFSDQTPAVQEVVSKIRNTKNTLLENLRSAITNSENALVEINNRLQAAEREINRLPSTERNLLSIQRQFSINENIYVYLLEKRAEAEITRASNSPTNGILDVGRSGSIPVSPKRSLNYLIGLILGLAVPIGFITVRDFFNRKIRDPKEVEKALKVPLIGLVGVSKLDTNLVIFSNPKSMITESFRNLRANMSFLSPRQSRLVVAISSSISGEGKTFCSINMASIYAISDKKCVLVGLDLRKPRIADDFNMINDRGVSTYLSTEQDWRSMIKTTADENLDVLLSGPPPPNPAELLLQDKFVSLMDELRETYDVVILDCPPIGLVSETLEIFKYADLNMMIVRQDYSYKQSIDFINNLHLKGSVKKLYAIMNGVEVDNGYGSYGTYGSYGYGSYGRGSHGYHEDEVKGNGWWKRMLKRRS
ncbi:MAG: polysaccharide biosynthesis tyrosine autokinase [Anditalea sp.]